MYKIESYFKTNQKEFITYLDWQRHCLVQYRNFTN